MKITKYKKESKGKYKVFLEDGQELILYEEVILQYDLLIHKEIDSETMILVDRSNQEWDVYYVALHSIENRLKSVYELREWLLRKEYPVDLINQAIDKLIQQGYLNDRGYVKSYINNQIITTSKGPYRLMRELEEKKIDFQIISEEIVSFTDEEQESRIHKIIDKAIRTNHSRGGTVLKQKIYSDLKILGYDISIMNRVIEEYDFGNNTELSKKEYEKLMRKYSRKYQGDELERIVRDKLYKKGLQYEEG